MAMANLPLPATPFTDTMWSEASALADAATVTLPAAVMAVPPRETSAVAWRIDTWPDTPKIWLIARPGSCWTRLMKLAMALSA